MFKEFVHVFNPVKDIGMRARLRKYHKPLNITREEFAQFIRILKDSLVYQSLDSSDIDIIIWRA